MFASPRDRISVAWDNFYISSSFRMFLMSAPLQRTVCFCGRVWCPGVCYCFLASCLTSTWKAPTALFGKPSARATNFPWCSLCSLSRLCRLLGFALFVEKRGKLNKLNICRTSFRVSGLAIQLFLNVDTTGFGVNSNQGQIVTNIDSYLGLLVTN